MTLVPEKPTTSLFDNVLDLIITTVSFTGGDFAWKSPKYRDCGCLSSAVQCHSAVGNNVTNIFLLHFIITFCLTRVLTILTSLACLYCSEAVSYCIRHKDATIAIACNATAATRTMHCWCCICFLNHPYYISLWPFQLAIRASEKAILYMLQTIEK